MLIIDKFTIRELNISPSKCLEWIEESFRIKHKALLPPKISIHPQADDFFNTMPCCLPNGFFGVKEVSRISGRIPSLRSELLLYKSDTGELLALMDADWITAMRTGAAAAISIRNLAKRTASSVSFIGLGNTARSISLCILEMWKDRDLTFKLLKYKNQAEDFINRFENYPNIKFEIYNSIEELVKDSEILVSSINSAEGLLCGDDTLFPEGMLLVPVHTRGFQNCDLFFDQVYGDDKGHVEGFKYFSKFKEFKETSEIILEPEKGRRNDSERILVYNIGLALHDVYFASKIYEMIDSNCFEITLKKETSKFWI